MFIENVPRAHNIVDDAVILLLLISIDTMLCDKPMISPIFKSVDLIEKSMKTGNLLLLLLLAVFFREREREKLIKSKDVYILINV